VQGLGALCCPSHCSFPILHVSILLFPSCSVPFHPQAVACGVKSSAWWWWPCLSTSQAGLGSGVVLLALVVVILPWVFPPADMVCCSCPVLIPIIVCYCCCFFIFIVVSVCCHPCSHPHCWGTLVVVIGLSSQGCCYGGGVHCPACPSSFFVIILWSHGIPSIASLSAHKCGSQPW
jgi:hypothetical protein